MYTHKPASAIRPRSRRGLERSEFHLRVGLVLLLITAAVLAGCGSGGGSTSTLPGTVSGNVAARSAAGGSLAPVPAGTNATVDGTNLTSPVGSDGSFSLPPLPPGTYNISVISPGNGGAAHATVQVTSGATTAVSLTLLPAGQVAGIVSQRSAAGQLQPVSGVTVTLNESGGDVPPVPIFAPGGPATEGSRGKAASASALLPAPVATADFHLQTTTASDGTYSFQGVPVGFYQIQVSSGDLSGSDFITVTPAHTTAADVVLAPSAEAGEATVSGTVFAADLAGTHPLAGAYVRFSLPPFCGIGQDGGPTPTGGGTASGGSVGTGTATGGEVFGGSPPPAPPGQTGNPQGAGGLIVPCPAILPPVEPGAPADLNTAGLPILVPIGARTDDQGRYTLRVPVFAQRLVAQAPGYIDQDQSVTLTAGATTTVDFTLQPAPPAPVLSAAMTVNGQSGPVTEAAGSPLNITLTLTNTGTTAAPITIFGGGDDVQVLDSSGQALWDINAGRVQPDYVGSSMLQPGKSVTISETWPGDDNNGAPLTPGSYTLAGSIEGYRTPPLALTVTASSPPVP